MAIFDLYVRKYLTVVSNTATIAFSRKFSIVDLLQISLLGAFIHAVLSRAYLCVS